MNYRNKRYVINVPFADSSATGTSFDFAAQTKSATIDRDFQLSSISACVRMTGQVTGGSFPAAYFNVSMTTQFSTVSEDFYWFDFLWTLTDTQRQREWTRGWQPSSFLHSNPWAGPLALEKRAHLPAGDELRLTVLPIVSRRYVDADPVFITVSQYTVEVSFSGLEAA